MNGVGHFFFTPVTGVWFPNLRRLFFFFFGVIFVVNLACIFLTLMWIALGVVVNPALAIPYATVSASSKIFPALSRFATAAYLFYLGNHRFFYQS